jgi:hypothetical protein
LFFPVQFPPPFRLAGLGGGAVGGCYCWRCTKRLRLPDFRACEPPLFFASVHSYCTAEITFSNTTTAGNGGHGERQGERGREGGDREREGHGRIGSSEPPYFPFSFAQLPLSKRQANQPLSTAHARLDAAVLDSCTLQMGGEYTLKCSNL